MTKRKAKDKPAGDQVADLQAPPVAEGGKNLPFKSSASPSPDGLDPSPGTAPAQDGRDAQNETHPAGLDALAALQEAVEQYGLRLALPPDLVGKLTPAAISWVYAYAHFPSTATATKHAGLAEQTGRRYILRLQRPGPMRRALEWIRARRAEQGELGIPWWVNELADTYRVARAAVQVLDRKGNPTGDYKVDGATAVRCLELLGRHFGALDQRLKVEHGGTVRHLVELVAAAGRPVPLGAAQQSSLADKRATQVIDSTARAENNDYVQSDAKTPQPSDAQAQTGNTPAPELALTPDLLARMGRGSSDRSH